MPPLAITSGKLPFFWAKKLHLFTRDHTYKNLNPAYSWWLGIIPLRNWKFGICFFLPITGQNFKYVHIFWPLLCLKIRIGAIESCTYLRFRSVTLRLLYDIIRIFKADSEKAGWTQSHDGLKSVRGHPCPGLKVLDRWTWISKFKTLPLNVWCFLKRLKIAQMICWYLFWNFRNEINLRVIKSTGQNNLMICDYEWITDWSL